MSSTRAIGVAEQFPISMRPGIRTSVKVKLEEKFTVTIDNDSNLNYEKNVLLYRLSLPLMWILTIWVMIKKITLKSVGRSPQINTLSFDGLSIPCREIKEGAASWKALDIIYNHRFGSSLRDIKGKVSDFWIGMINAQAVRNRLKLVKRELADAIREVARKEEEVRIFSIASGSAQAVLETMTEVLKEGINVRAFLLDMDPTAIEYSEKMAEEYGLKDRVDFIMARTGKIEEVAKDFNPQIVEMVGFLDYRSHQKAITLVKRIHKILPNGGKFLTANMIPNLEQHFMKWVINWIMIYRKPKELLQILVRGGFNADFGGSGTVQIICEPHRLHAVAICEKR